MNETLDVVRLGLDVVRLGLDVVRLGLDAVKHKTDEARTRTKANRHGTVALLKYHDSKQLPKKIEIMLFDVRKECVRQMPA